MLRIVDSVENPDKNEIYAAIADYALRRDRHYRKHIRDLDNDDRITVGARMLREDALRIQEAAKQTGRSVYRFVIDAVEKEAAACGYPQVG